MRPGGRYVRIGSSNIVLAASLMDSGGIGEKGGRYTYTSRIDALKTKRRWNGKTIPYSLSTALN
jgi:hypothetical protein